MDLTQIVQDTVKKLKTGLERRGIIHKQELPDGYKGWILNRELYDDGWQVQLGLICYPIEIVGFSYLTGEYTCQVREEIPSSFPRQQHAGDTLYCLRDHITETSAAERDCIW